jgi:diaminopimelate epimerase
MKKINFSKMVASGNDFVVMYRVPFVKYGVRSTEYRAPELAKKICDRKFGVGADGLLILEKSKIADIKMRIFNADGSEAEMCGNGARCVALFLVQSTEYGVQSKKLKIETKAGIIEAQVKNDNVRIKLTDPKNLKLNIPIKINNRTLHANFINTGVPHTVIFTEGLEKIDVFNLGRQIRYHKKFGSVGTNVDFVEALKNDFIKIRTYERGVEDETLACGTGSVAAALITALCTRYTVGGTQKTNVLTQSGETLKVYFDRLNNKFQNVWLEGKAKIAYKGEYNV